MIDKVDDKYYYEENVQYDRVTKILNSYPKPALYNWYASKGLKECRRIMKEAREFGTQVHKFIHANLNGDLQASQPKQDEVRMLCTMQEFMKWKNKHSPEPKRLEYSVINKVDMYGGTIDFVGNIDGVMSIADWKSSKDIYDDYPLQLAAYLRAYKLMHPDENIEEGRIVVFRCDEEGNCKTKSATYSAVQLDKLFQVFLGVKRIHDYKYGMK